MPRLNGTGPMGQGSMTGRGMGPCGRGLRRGGAWLSQTLGRGLKRRRTAIDEKTSLDEEEKILKEELAQVQAEKNTLADQK